MCLPVYERKTCIKLRGCLSGMFAMCKVKAMQGCNARYALKRLRASPDDIWDVNSAASLPAPARAISSVKANECMQCVCERTKAPLPAPARAISSVEASECVYARVRTCINIQG